METLWQDIKYGVRTLGKNPGFTTVAVLTLALGLGVNTAIFSIVKGLLYADYPYSAQHELVNIQEAYPTRGWQQVSVSFGNYVQWKEQSKSFADMAAHDGRSFALTGQAGPQRIVGRLATANLFSLLGRKAAMGQTFRPGDDAHGADKVVVLSHGLWQRHFGGAEDMIGRTINLNEEPYTVIGVMPSDFFFPEPDSELWVPFEITGKLREARGGHSYAAIGRLAPEVSRKKATTEMKAIAHRLEQQYPDTNTGWGVTLTPLREALVGSDGYLMLTIIYLAVGFVLLIACANVANLLLARVATREKEVAVRMALGARRSRLIRQLLTESSLLALIGGVAGVLVAYVSFNFIVRLIPEGDSAAAFIKLDTIAFLYTFALALGTGLLFGVVPAFHGTRAGLHDSLKIGGRNTSDGSRHRLLKSLVVLEVTLAVILLAGGGIMVRSYRNIASAQPGFETANLLTFRVTLPDSRYEESHEKAAFFRTATERVEALPGVLSVGAVQSLPMSGSNSWSSILLEEFPAPEPGEEISVGYLVTAGRYFQTMGIPLLQGRLFGAQDSPDSMPVIIINQTFGKKYWSDEDNYLGKRIKIGDLEDDTPWRTVVGVVGNIHHQSIQSPPRAEVFLPSTQKGRRTLTVLARTEGDPLNSAAAVREAIWAIDSNLPVYRVQTMEGVIRERETGDRAVAEIMGGVALLALVLAAVGIYGVIAFSVSERTQEFGIRMALGASSGKILGMVVRQGMTLVGIGLALGMVGAYGTMQVLQSVLFGISSGDPITYVGLPLLLLAVALLASYLPARRATRVDPMVALRYE